jgi:NADH dehydrogenase
MLASVFIRYFNQRAAAKNSINKGGNAIKHQQIDNKQPHRVVIVGGGFGGLYAARELGKSSVHLTLIDKRNFHLFQPLLYQVATGGLSPGDISSPLRAILNKYENICVIKGNVTSVEPDRQMVYADGETIPYDSLIIATGAGHHYFGNPHWGRNAPGLKTVEDAIQMRQKIFQAFESAEREKDRGKCRALMTFVVVGGGPTGVELAGVLAELAYSTLRKDFCNINTRESRILLLEGMERILPTYPPKLSKKADKSLQKLGVKILTNTFVTEINEGAVKFKTGGNTSTIASHTILWAAGVKAGDFGEFLAQKTGANQDKSGRVIVEPDLSLPNYPNIFIIGDLTHYAHQTGNPLPGIAPVAMQQGRYVARLLKKRLKGKRVPPFRYFNKGNLAVIGRNKAVADFGFTGFSGWVAWLIWIFVHIAYLIEYDNRVLVLFQWATNYFTRKRGARLITGDQPQDQALNPEKTVDGTISEA